MRRPALRLAALLLWTAPFVTGPTAAQEAHSALALARQNAQKADFRASGHLVAVDGSGARISYPITVMGHWFAGELRVLVEVSPAGKGGRSERTVPVHVLLDMHPGLGASIRVAHPGDAAVTVLPVDKWSDGVAGTGFSYEDFLEGQLFWSGQAVTEHVKRGARDCDLIVSTPGPADKTSLSQVRTWLDRGIGFPVYVEKTAKGKGAVREFTYFGLRHDGGVWSASQIEEKNHGQPGTTLLIIDRGSAKANLTAQDFSLERFTHF